MRRTPEALERLIDLHQANGNSGESILDFFRRVELSVLRAAVADLEVLDLGNSGQEHLLDLAETKRFVVDTKPGECAGP